MSASDKASRISATGERAPLPRPPQPALGPGEVHLWLAELDLEPSVLESLRDVLSSEELARARELKLDSDRSRFIASRAFLRETLAGYLDTEPAKLRFRAGPEGKPLLAPDEGAPDLRFNLSHPEGRALLAVSMGLEVGIDLERIGSAKTAREIAGRFFTSSERAYLDTLPEPEGTEAFYLSWTIKEAFLKATGRGLAGGLEGLAVSFEDGRAELKRFKGERLEAVDGWHVRSLKPFGGYAGAIAVSGSPTRVLTFRWL